MTNAAAFTMRDRKVRCCNDNTVLVSLPVYNQLSSPHSGLNETKWERVMIKLKD